MEKIDEIITEEQYWEIRRTGMWMGKPIELQKLCPGCGTPIGQHNKPHNKRPDKTDKRCTNCVEVPKMQAWLEAACRKRRVERYAQKIIRRPTYWRHKDGGYEFDKHGQRKQKAEG